MKKKIFSFALIAIVALTMSSCEKETGITFTVDATAFPAATEVVIDIVPSLTTDVAVSVPNARLGLNEVIMTAEQRSLLTTDAYYSVIVFDEHGEYLTQNFFPADSKLLILK